MQRERGREDGEKERKREGGREGGGNFQERRRGKEGRRIGARTPDADGTTNATDHRPSDVDRQSERRREAFTAPKVSGERGEGNRHRTPRKEGREGGGNELAKQAVAGGREGGREACV